MANDAAEDAHSERHPAGALRTLAMAGMTHALHDGYTDILYVLLPIWQSEFSLGYGALALLRATNTGVMAAFQIPAALLSSTMGIRRTLTLGTALAGIGYGLAAFTDDLTGLILALALSGLGSSTQHPLASAAVARAYGRASRRPLAIYNFAGDIGKALLPVLLAAMLSLMHWRRTFGVLAALGLLTAVATRVLMPPLSRHPHVRASMPLQGSGRRGFTLLFAIGVLDTGVRMGFLIFLPFLLKSKGASVTELGVALGLVFAGGAMGKLFCGWLTARQGALVAVIITELGTAALIVSVLLAPLALSMCILPPLGIMLNGTSSVLYGTVPELADSGRTEPLFAIFYTGIMGSSALFPVLFGLLGDQVGAAYGVLSAAAISVLICAPACVLYRGLSRS